MDARIGRAALVAGLAVLAAGLQTSAPAQIAPPPAPIARPTPTPAPDLIERPAPEPARTEGAMAPAPNPGNVANAAAPETAQSEPETAAPQNKVLAPPPPPPAPARAPAAVLRVLDKVTAETIVFEAPIGRRVRYKRIVFEVKTCVTRDVSAPRPRPSAYVVITSDAGSLAGAATEQRQIFRGWMFANAPGVHALTHPVYDAWLVSCTVGAPVG